MRTEASEGSEMKKAGPRNGGENRTHKMRIRARSDTAKNPDSTIENKYKF